MEEQRLKRLKISGYSGGDKFEGMSCECHHTLNEHDFKIKEGVVLFGGCKKCSCKGYKKLKR